jgi:hypothetical protein
MLPSENPFAIMPVEKYSRLLFKGVYTLLVLTLLNLSSLFAQSCDPHAMPMKANPDNSIEASWLAKPVLSSRLLDNMEDLSTWTKSGTANMSLTNERFKDGKSSLRITLSNIRPKGSRGYPAAGISHRFNNEDWSEYNRISVWIYPEQKNGLYMTLALTITNSGANKVPDVFGRNGRDDIILEPGKWNHVVWEIPFLSRDKITGLAMFHLIQGKERAGIGDEATFDFDMLELQKVNPDHYEGWNVAPGMISFSHSGYQTGGQKTAIMDIAGAREFSLINSLTGRVVLTKPVKRMDTYINKFNVLDFSEVRQEGTYFLKAGDVMSRQFRIGDDVWKESIWKNINYWYCQRCGFEVPGLHDACHRDVTATKDSLKIIVTSGWHDAGDLTQMIYNTAPAVYAMFSLADQFKNSDKELCNRLLEEGNWGLDWMLKTRFGNGYRHNFGGIGQWTDGIMGNGDDINFRAQNLPFENFLSATTIARAAKTLRKIDPVKADQCIKAAAEDWEAAIAKMTRGEVEIDGEAILSSLTLYELTGEAKYAEKARQIGDSLMKSQQQVYPDWKVPFVGFFYRDPDKIQVLRYNPISQEHAPAMALEKLCNTFPNDPKWIEWYTALVLNAEYIKAASRYTQPYGMIPASIYNVDEVHKRSLYGLQQSSLMSGNQYGTYKDQVKNGMELGKGNYMRLFPVWFGHRGNFGIILAEAKALAVASHMRKDLDGINLSRQQLEWIVGKNPFCQSTMWGEGYDFSPLYTPSSGHLVGGLPVGIQTDENKDVPFWPASILYNYKEIWSNPDARWLWLMEEVTLPSTIEITGDNSKDLQLKIVEKTTGEIKDITVSKGEKCSAINLPEGNYKAQYNGMEREFILLPGENYVLDTSNPFTFSVLQESVAPGKVRISITAQGKGKVQFEMRGWNIQLGKKIQNSAVLEDKPVKLVWEATVTDAKKPWVAVIIPDGKVSEGKEIKEIKM